MNKRFLVWLFIFSLAVEAANVVFAHGEIVYSARYYLPPGAPGLSHYHIYRIDPDGRGRTQLTSATADDWNPKWADKGKHISFEREASGAINYTDMVMNADGSDQHRASIDTVRTPNSTFVSRSPDGKYDCVSSADGNYYNIIKTTTNRQSGRFPDPDGEVLWLRGPRLGVLSGNGHENRNTYSESYEFTTYGIDGKQLSSIILADLTRHDRLYNAETQWGTNFGWIDCFHPDRRRPHCYYFEMAGHQETLGWFDLANKTVKVVCTAMSESGSPDGRKVCASVFLGPMPYEREVNGQWRTVWTSYLAVADRKNLGVQYIQSGNLSCTGVDWLGGTDKLPW